MSFSSLNGVNAAKGLQGSNRMTGVTFAGAGAPLQGAPQGMSGGSMQAAPVLGSSYTKGLGMQAAQPSSGSMSGQTGGAIGMVNSGALSGGIVPGKQVPSAVPYAPPQMMSQADAQDPNNAAMAGFAHAAGQIQAPPPPPPQQTPQGKIQQALGGGQMRGGNALGPANNRAQMTPEHAANQASYLAAMRNPGAPPPTGGTHMGGGTPDISPEGIQRQRQVM